jgi:GT2 family glycosyltransferase
MSDALMLSIVIVSWNVKDLLRDCLRSVGDQTRLGDDTQVIVVDNASSDGSADMVRAEFPWVRLVENAENEGFARANNRAARLTDSRYLLLLNPDTVVIGRAIDRLCDWMERHPSAAVAGCRLLNSDGTLQRWTGGALPNLLNLAGHHWFLDRLLPAPLRARPMFRLRDTAEDERVGWVSGACLIARREALAGAVFDESYFMYAEDVVLCERVAAAGWEVWYTPGATVIHHHGRSIGQQSGAVALAPIAGPRRYFSGSHGALGTLAFDLITASGFLLRWASFGTLSLVSWRDSDRLRARANRRSFGLALQVMRGHS